MNIKPVKSNDPQSWVRAVYDALGTIDTDDWDSDGSRADDRDKNHDEVMTAMAWICASLDINPMELEEPQTAPLITAPLAGYEYHFPDFDTVPAFLGVAGWVDTSWKNDTCPSVENTELIKDKDVKIWTEYAAINKRELPEEPQYYVAAYDKAGDFSAVLISTDNLNEVKTLIHTLTPKEGKS